jgi:hypothetical protein
MEYVPGTNGTTKLSSSITRLKKLHTRFKLRLKCGSLGSASCGKPGVRFQYDRPVWVESGRYNRSETGQSILVTPGFEMKNILRISFLLASAISWSPLLAKQTSQESQILPANRNGSAEVAEKSAGKPKSDVAWDEFRHRTNMVWACRNIYTGFIVNTYKCKDQPKEDKVWPDKDVPADYSGQGIAVPLSTPGGH